MPKETSLTIPGHFFADLSSSESSFSSKPSPHIAPQRLINGKNDFYINQSDTTKPIPKTLILNHGKALLWLPLLKKLQASGFNIVWTYRKDLTPLNLERKSQTEYLLEKPDQDSIVLHETVCRNFGLSADSVLVIDDACWAGFLSIQAPDLLLMSLEMIAHGLQSKALQGWLLERLKPGVNILHTQLSAYMSAVKSRLIREHGVLVSTEPTEIKELSENDHFTDDGLIIGDELIEFRQMSEVVHVDLSKRAITTATLNCLGKHAPKLKILNVYSCQITCDIPDELHFESLEMLTLPITNMTAVNVEKLIKAMPKLQNLQLTDYEKLKGDLTGDLNLPELKTLDLNYSPIDVNNLTHLLGNTPLLQKLNLSDCKNLTGDLPDDLYLPALTRLDLTRSTITADNLARLIKAAPLLQHLNLAYCKNLTGDLPDLNLPALTTLDLSNTPITAPNFARLIKTARQLQHLKLEDCRNFTGNLPDDLNLPALTTLKLTHNPRTANFVSLIQQAPKLKVLSWYGSRQNVVYDLVEDLKLAALEELDLQSSHLGSSLEKFLKLAQGLEKLDLSYCQITSELANDLNLIALRSLNINFSQMSADCLVKLIQGSPKIKHLTLSGRLDLNSARLHQFDLAALESLGIESDQLTADNLGKLLKKTPGIRYLKLSSNHELTGDIPDDLNLAALNILYPGKINPNSLFNLMKSAPNLTQLHGGGRGITSLQDNPECFVFMEKYPKHPFSKALRESFQSNLSAPAGTDFPVCLRGNRATMIDAKPTSEINTFKFKRVFFGHDETRPEPVFYRLDTYNQLEINPVACDVTKAFHWSSTGDLALEPVVVSIGVHDVFHELPDNTSAAEHFYGKTTLWLNGQWQALPSLSSIEVLTHVHTEPKTEVDIQYSRRDNLYYIKSHDNEVHPVTIDFNLLIPTLPRKNLPAEITKKAFQLQAFHSNPLSMRIGSPTGYDYLAALIHQRTGSCRHRAVIFKAWMDENYPEIPCRIVSNNCHAFVEILYDGRWLTQDLGGTEATLEIDESSQPQLTAAEVEASTAKACFIAPEIKQAIEQAFPLNKEDEETPPTLGSLIQAYGSNQLLEVTSLDALYTTALSLQSLAQNQGRPVFMVDSPDDLICSAHYIKRTGNSGQITAGPGGRLHDFLTKYQDPANPPLIIVNYAAFEARDMVRFNQLIDATRLADGTPLPKATVVMGLTIPNAPGSYQGADFYSRFHAVTTLDSPPLTLPATLFDALPSVGYYDEKTTAHIELFNSNRWQQLVFGGWMLEKDQLIFKPGALVNAIKEGKSRFIFHNPPTSNRRFNHFIEAMRLFGGFTCEGEWIALPAGSLIHQESGFDWPTLRQAIAVEEGPLTPDAIVLNRQTLPVFLGQFDCDHQTKTLTQKPGIIEQNQSLTLPTYLTSDLTEAEWARLLSKAYQHAVRLTIKLSQGSTFPYAATTSTHHETPLATHRLDNINPTQVIISQQVDLTLAMLNDAMQKPCTVIDISEVESSELLTKIDGRFNQEKLSFEFTEQKGALLHALEAGKTVILKGNFKPDLIGSLAPLLMERARANAVPGQLIIIADKQEDFDFLPTIHLYQHQLDIKQARRAKKLQLSRGFPALVAQSLNNKTIDNTPLTALKAILTHQIAFPKGGDPWEGLETLACDIIKTGAIDFSNSQSKTTRFLNRRLARVEAQLKHSPYAFLSGLTGSGKSTFMLTQWKQKYPNCYFEKSSLEDWANDKRKGIKTLFIDEANISQSDYSQFEGLFNTPPGMLINNTYHQLTVNHKVIFAGNPVSYSDERHLGSFFKRHGGSVLFKSLPPYVLYERVIRPLLKSTHTEMQMQAIAGHFLIMQQFANHAAGKIIVSPRELITMVLLTQTYLKNHPKAVPDTVAHYYAYQITSNALPPSLRAEFNLKFPAPAPLERPLAAKASCVTDLGEFILTPSRQKLVDCLDDLITLRRHRQSLAMAQLTRLKANRFFSKLAAPDEHHEAKLYGGLNGLLVEGEPGIGKSELIVHQLIKQGFTKGQPGRNNNDKSCFYTMPASMNHEAKQNLLLQAFHEGNVVIIDEINASPMMERLINSLLTGYTSDGKRPNTPGFLLIGTQNPAHMAGRRKQSEALNRRMLQFQLPAYTDEEMKTILTAKSSLSEPAIDYLLSRYRQSQALATAHPPCFRDLLKILNMPGLAKTQASDTCVVNFEDELDALAAASSEEEDYVVLESNFQY